MSLYQINVDDEIIIEQIQDIINSVFERELKRKYGDTDRLLRDCIKELVYSRKDEIIEKVVDRATKEIVRKGMPKLLERMG